MSELKPCPFCGVEVDRSRSVHNTIFHPLNDCFLDTSLILAEKWNHRPLDSKPEDKDHSDIEERFSEVNKEMEAVEDKFDTILYDIDRRIRKLENERDGY